MADLDWFEEIMTLVVGIWELSHVHAFSRRPAPALPAGEIYALNRETWRACFRLSDELCNHMREMGTHLRNLNPPNGGHINGQTKQTT